MNLGSLFTPSEPEAQNTNPELKSKWDSWLADPKNKAGLLSFGLQAMMGGWGNGTQQLAAALGAGVEGYQGAAKIQTDLELKERERSDRLNQRAEDANLKRELNDADNNAAMARAKLGIGADREKRSEDRFWTTTFQSLKNKLEANNLRLRTEIARNKEFNLPTDNLEAQLLDETTIISRAASQADASVAARGGRSGKGNAGENTSEISRGTGGPVGLPPTTKAPVSGAPSEATIKGGTNTQAKDPSKDISVYLKNNPTLRANWNDPKKRVQMEALGYYDSTEGKQKKVQKGLFNNFAYDEMGNVMVLPKD